MTKPSESSLSHLSSSYSKDQMGYCFGHGCKNKGMIEIDESQWIEIQSLFATKKLTPDSERKAIAIAIGRIERIAGDQNGTSKDKAGTFMSDVGKNQLDCIDEAVNTSNFIDLLQRDGLIKHHELRQPILRSWVNGNILHATAVLEQIDSPLEEKTTLWSVDSSFFKNGESATVAPLTLWQQGWVPEGGVN
ncbi:hypothetical protein [Kiloniella antarctica]|uniref:Uncharacterized protein n=1 Tax=Kiloniella antarctica TaxID=1550907 RepID=A0ABW5BPX4_9PROT